MAGLILAAPINPDNTPHGYNWTFAFPMLLFIVIGGVLYLLFSRPHRRVPARGISLRARAGVPAAGGPHGAYLAASGEPEPTDTAPADTWQAGGGKDENTGSGEEPPGSTAQSAEDKE